MLPLYYPSVTAMVRCSLKNHAASDEEVTFAHFNYSVDYWNMKCTATQIFSGAFDFFKIMELCMIASIRKCIISPVYKYASYSKSSFTAKQKQP
jgi:hypothetical protein